MKIINGNSISIIDKFENDYLSICSCSSESGVHLHPVFLLNSCTHDGPQLSSPMNLFLESKILL